MSESQSQENSLSDTDLGIERIFKPQASTGARMKGIMLTYVRLRTSRLLAGAEGITGMASSSHCLCDHLEKVYIVCLRVESMKINA